MPDSDPASDTVVVHRLIASTTRGKVAWTKDDHDGFTAVIGETELHVYPRDHDGVAPFVLQVISDTGQAEIVHRISNDRDAALHNAAMRELFDAAKLSSVTTNPAVQTLMQDLERIDPEPPF